MTEHIIENLITGSVRALSRDEIGRNAVMTQREKMQRGDCDYACEWVAPYGWIPQADCPVHDREEE